MARKKLIRSEQFPYHISTRCNNREWFDLGMTSVWSLAMDALTYASNNIKVNIESFVLMSNHYHLILFTPDGNVDEFMRYFNWKFSQGIRMKTKRINHIFGSRYNWSLIDNDKYYYQVLRYVFQNPLKINLVKNCEDYIFSTLYFQSRNINLPIKLNNNWASETYIKYFNLVIEEEKREILSRSLRRNGYFKPTQSKGSRRNLLL